MADKNEKMLFLKKLEKYTDIPRLSFEFEAKEYVYMADTMEQINYILKNIQLIEMGKQNLKTYKDDPDTIANIKETMKYYEDTINESLKRLEENYLEHCKDLDILNKFEEEENEQ